MKIATWNVNSIKVRLEQVLACLDHYDLDVLALQETKVTDDNFPKALIEEAGYEVCFAGQKTYNGVAIIAKSPPSLVLVGKPQFPDDQVRLLSATINGIRVVNVYVPNGQSIDSDKYNYKLNWLAALKKYLTQTIAEHDKVIVLGDFNIAPEDQDVHDPLAWEGHVLVSPRERTAFNELLSLGFRDSFRLFDQPEKSYSWWDYRQGGFRRNRGLRIDHILITENLAQACLACVIEKTPRTWERPSDHTLVIAELAIT